MWLKLGGSRSGNFVSIRWRSELSVSDNRSHRETCKNFPGLDRQIDHGCFSLIKLGDVVVQMGQVGEAKSWFRRAKKISEKRMQTTPGLSATCPLASTSWAMHKRRCIARWESGRGERYRRCHRRFARLRRRFSRFNRPTDPPTLLRFREASAFARRSREERARRGSRTRGCDGLHSDGLARGR